MTEEETAELSVKNAERTAKQKARKEAARALIKGFFEEDSQKRADRQVEAPIKEAILYMAGMGARTKRTTASTLLREMLLAGDVSSVDIFTAFEFGRPTMAKKINEFIKNGEPENRIWVAFDENTKTYSVAGQGENPPEGWTGYLPTPSETL